MLAIILNVQQFFRKYRASVTYKSAISHVWDIDVNRECF